MPRRIIAFVALAVALAAVFVRLGVWQLSRLGERRTHNALVSARLARPEVPFSELKSDSVAAYRRVLLEGFPDTANEFLVTGRSRSGSPGVHIITPMRRKDGDAVLVNRGWVYAPDAATVDLRRWRERRTAYHGYTLNVPYTTELVSGKKRAMRDFGFEGIKALVPYKVGNVYVVAQDSGAIDSIPARLPLPVLDDGPHLNYAVQWFSFAAIAIAGATVVAVRSRRRRGTGDEDLVTSH